MLRAVDGAGSTAPVPAGQPQPPQHVRRAQMNAWDWYIGAGLILIYASGRFNRPRINRVSTTRLRFYGAATAYCVATFLLYVLLAGPLSDSTHLPSFLQIGASGENPLEKLNLSGPLVAALALTVLLPNFPVIAQIDERLLQFFKVLGNIPLEAILQSEQLYRSEVRVPAAMRAELQAYVRNRLELSGITEGDLAFDDGRDSPQGYWTVLLSLILQIEAWHGRRTYVGVFNDLQEEYAQIQTRFEKVTVASARYFCLLHDLPPGDRSPDRLLTECRRNFREQCDELYRELCRFIARGVLKSEWTRAERHRTFARMGFDSAHQIGETLNPNQVVTLVAMLFSVLLIALTVVGSHMQLGARMGIQRAFMISIMVATIYGAAVVAAVLLKARWPRTGAERPVLGYLAAGAAAIARGAVRSVIFKSLLFGSFYEALFDLRYTYPYLALAFMAAVTTSFLCDDYAMAPAAAPRIARWLEGLAAAGVLAAIAYFVWHALPGTKIEPSRIPPLSMLLSTASLIGLIIGCMVPTWYRRAIRRCRADHVASSAAPAGTYERAYA
jgi:hypothetical protein